MSNGSANSLTEAGPRHNRSSTRRRVGSDSARNTVSIEAVDCGMASIQSRSECDFTNREPYYYRHIVRSIPKFVYRRSLHFARHGRTPPISRDRNVLAARPSWKQPSLGIFGCGSPTLAHSQSAPEAPRRGRAACRGPMRGRSLPPPRGVYFSRVSFWDRNAPGQPGPPNWMSRCPQDPLVRPRGSPGIAGGNNANLAPPQGTRSSRTGCNRGPLVSQVAELASPCLQPSPRQDSVCLPVCGPPRAARQRGRGHMAESSGRLLGCAGRRTRRVHANQIDKRIRIAHGTAAPSAS